jgi:hypothetical protein
VFPSGPILKEIRRGSQFFVTEHAANPADLLGPGRHRPCSKGRQAEGIHEQTMRLIFVAAVMACAACGVGGNKNWQSTTQPLSCDQGDVPIYTNRFTPQSGGSGVATGADAAAGKINSDGSSGPTTGGADPAGPTGAGGGATTPPQVDPTGPLTAMVATCGQAQCAPFQVAVEFPAAPAGGGVASGAAFSDAAGAPASGGDTAPTDPPNQPAPTVKCAPPPPDCQPGFSPQFTGHDTWECTDCALVVTYGGIYGNYRRCVNAPTIACPQGQVPTWSYDKEIWECKDTCDNGMYDQHTIEGQLVCVPC